MPRSGEPHMLVSGEHVRQAVAYCVDVLEGVPAAQWHDRAGGLEWTCWETLEHLADDLLTYALRFGLAQPMDVPRVPLRISTDRPGGPANVVFGDQEAGPGGLLTAVEACGGLLAAVIDATDATTMAPHVFGASDPEGFAAMGVVETLVHTHDIAQGLDRIREPPQDLSERVLARLFPDVPVIDTPWSTLLWATGRIGTPDRPRRTNWRWYGVGGQLTHADAGCCPASSPGAPAARCSSPAARPQPGRRPSTCARRPAGPRLSPLSGAVRPPRRRRSRPARCRTCPCRTS